ncbi:hypothetical protein Tco_1501793 [Tanacetum coccineum]
MGIYGNQLVLVNEFNELKGMNVTTIQFIIVVVCFETLVLKNKKYGESNAYSLEDLKLELEKPCQRDSSKLIYLITVMNGNPSRVNIKQLCGRYKQRCCSLIPAELNSLPHAQAQTTKAYYKHQDSRIKEA